MLVAALPRTAAAVDARAAFERGVEAAGAGDFGAAVRHFEAARDAGLDTGALHFNLGVAFYRTGRTAAARASFRRAWARDGMAAPAAYNLGRIAAERGDSDAARTWFRRAAREAEREALRSRAEARLAELDAPGPDRWDGIVRVGAGVDSNVAAEPDGVIDSSEARDTFLEASLYARRTLGRGWFADGFGYLDAYDDADRFDLRSLSAGGGWRGAAGGGTLVLAARARDTRLGGDPYERALALDAQLERGDLVLGYRVTPRDGRGDFGYLDGIGHRLRVEVTPHGRPWSVSVELERRDRDDLGVGDDFFSFSWTGVAVDAAWSRSLGSRVRLELDAELGLRRYDDPEVRNGGSLGARDARLLEAAVRLEGPLTERWRWRAGLVGERRASDVDAFDYDRARLAASVALRF